MIGRLLASAAFAVALTGTAMAQMAAPPATNPPAASTGSGAMGAPTSLARQPAGKPAMGLSADRQTAQGAPQGTPKLNVAGQLNACEAKPISQRQACIAAATRM